MNAVNLLPDAPRPRGARRRVRPAGGGAIAPVAVALVGAAALLGLGHLAYSASGDSDNLRAEIAAVEGQRAQLEQELEQFRVAAGAAQLQRARSGAVVALTRGRTDWQRLIWDTTNVVPAGIWIDRVTGGSESAAPSADGAAPAAAAAPTLKLNGIASAQGDVARLLVRLATVPGLSDPRLISSTENGERVLEYEIDLAVDRRAQERGTVLAVAGPGGRRP